MWSTSSRPSNRPRNGFRWRRRSKANPFVAHRPSRDSGGAHPHPGHPPARRRPPGEGACRFRLTCVTRNFLKNGFSKIVHGRRRAAGSMDVDVWGLALGNGAAGNLLARGSSVSLHFACYRIVIFLTPLATAAEVGSSHARSKVATGG